MWTAKHRWACWPYHWRMSGNDAPRIGLTMYREPASWGVWSGGADLLPDGYTAAVRRSGGLAVLLPSDDAGRAGQALDVVQGLVLTGGSDLDPAEYGSPAHAQTGAPQSDRDAWELALARVAIDRGLPVLAVCRGMQVLNVALGGTLIQHLPETVGTDLHKPSVGTYGRHDVITAPGSRLAEMLGARAEVATHHHQAVDRLGDGLLATVTAIDGIVEGVELPGPAWQVGVQWHPEAFEGERLFAGLTGAARHSLIAAASSD